MAEIERKVEINFSMQNMLDLSTFWALIAPIEFYSAIARKLIKLHN